MAQSALLTIMTAAARKAARSLKRDFGEVENLQVSRKGPADFVSAADQRAEEVIFEELHKSRPTYSFLMEERGAIEGTDGQHRWIIDPLDGTTNFLHSIPAFAVSIGLERNGVMVAGVIYNPITEELFTAERGSGAYVNNRRLRVAGRNHLADCVAVTGIKQTSDVAADTKTIAQVAKLNNTLAGIRRTGSAALDLAWVAAGRFDLMWEIGLQPWDIAAGMLMIREAGGLITDIKGKEIKPESGSVLAGNEKVHAKLLKELKAI
ncbi:inositol monophosphatase family protein [Maritalea porphyrae]|uniref:Inositol-1-monophosphatase n=1 Tax=Maritalea porphyrae TaxID=880732 RepID=A0ABQ5UM27_9HYPH|nr:inositol monophosphatase family protein [Maritalea porphyrae]GLQ16264.1 inositol monophosphatase [Maritalea porphyrae]